MSLMAKKPDNEFEYELVPPGNHAAVCCHVIDLGLQDDTYMGEPKVVHKVRIDFEIAQKKKDGAPFIVTKTYTLSMGEKANLRQDLQSWRGRPFTPEESDAFDVSKVLGANAMINVIHKVSKTSGNEYPVIAGVTPLPKGLPPVAPTAPQILFSKELPNWRQVYESLEDWMKKLINTGEGGPAPSPHDQHHPQQAPGQHHEPPIEAYSDDDIPF